MDSEEKRSLVAGREQLPTKPPSRPVDGDEAGSEAGTHISQPTAGRLTPRETSRPRGKC